LTAGAAKAPGKGRRGDCDLRALKRPRSTARSARSGNPVEYSVLCTASGYRAGKIESGISKSTFSLAGLCVVHWKQLYWPVALITKNSSAFVERRRVALHFSVAIHEGSSFRLVSASRAIFGRISDVSFGLRSLQAFPHSRGNSCWKGKEKLW